MKMVWQDAQFTQNVLFQFLLYRFPWLDASLRQSSVLMVIDFGGTVLGVYTVIGRYPLTADSDHPLDFFHNFPLKLADVTITQFLNKFLHLGIS